MKLSKPDIETLTTMVSGFYEVLALAVVCAIVGTILGLALALKNEWTNRTNRRK